MTILEEFQLHTTLSTAKNTNGMSGESRKFLYLYLKKYYKFIGENTQSISKSSFIKWLATAKLAKSTKGIIASGLGKFLYWVGKINQDDFNVIKQAFKPPSYNWSTQQLSDDNVVLILDIFRDGAVETWMRNYCIFTLMATIGLRISQIINLKHSDVIIKDDGIDIMVELQKQNLTDQKDSSKSVKVIPVEYHIKNHYPYKIIQEYEGLLKHPVKKDSPFFTNRKGNKLTQNYLQKIARDVSKITAINFTPHSLRHYVGHKIANQQGILNAAVMLDHQKLTSTMKYINNNNISTANMLNELN